MHVPKESAAQQVINGKKGKEVTIETDDEEEDLQALISAIEEEEDVEEDIQLLRSTRNYPHMSLRGNKNPKYRRIWMQ